MNIESMTIQEAYKAMYLFLEQYYKLTNADDVGALLGGLATLPDGTPADPASWQDWVLAVEAARSEQADISLRLDDRQPNSTT